MLSTTLDQVLPMRINEKLPTERVYHNRIDPNSHQSRDYNFKSGFKFDSRLSKQIVELYLRLVFCIRDKLANLGHNGDNNCVHRG